MVICKFFLQGTCKFGDYCRFEHQVPTTYTSFSDPPASILRQSNFGASHQTNTNNTSTKNQNVDTNTLVKSVVNDMISAEKGGQWLLSCYAPFKEKPAFPGFSDQSFEEVRLGYYEAVKNGTIEQYKIQLQAILQDVMMKVKALQNPSPDIINILKTIYNTPVSNTKGNVFNSNTTNSFQKPTPVFRSQQPSGSSIFATANQNLFGSTPASTSNNIFGSTASSNSIFGAPAQNKSIFGAQQQPNTQPNSFGNQTTNQSLFAQNNSVFGNHTIPNQSAFGSQHQNATQSIFGQQNSQSLFGIPPQQTGQSMEMIQPQPNTGQSVFAAPNQSAQSVFGGQQNPNVQPPFQLQSQHSPNSIFAASNPVATLAQQNIFGNPILLTPNMNSVTNPLATQPVQNANQQNPLVHQHTASIFGAPQIPQTVGDFNTPQQQHGSVFAQLNPNQQNSNNIFGGGGINLQATVADGSLYSKLEELTDEEKNWFIGDDLDIYSIPEKPPTYEMCFKT